jgi:hypothetical protein
MRKINIQKQSLWQQVSLQSKVNGALYCGDQLPLDLADRYVLAASLEAGAGLSQRRRARFQLTAMRKISHGSFFS